MSARRDYGAGSIQARGKSRWLVQVEQGRDPSTGRRRRRRFTVQGTKKDAQVALRAVLLERDQGLDVPADKITLAEWLPRWLQQHHAEGSIGPTTRDRYERIVRKHLIPMLGDVRLQGLRADQIDAAKSRWMSGEDSTSAAPLSNSTVHQHLVVLGAALDRAVKQRLIAFNPMNAVSVPSAKNRNERRALTETEIAALLATAAGGPMYAPVAFLLQTGVREGECLGLRWTDFDWVAGTVTVQRTLRALSGEGLVLGPTKTRNSRRTIELSPSTVELMRRHRARQAEIQLQLGADWVDRALVFPNSSGGLWWPHSFYHAFKKVVQAADLVEPNTVTVHTLRHTAGTMWLKAGTDVFTVSRRLGHASASFTMDTYGHLLSGMQRTASEALDHLIAQSN